MRNLGQSDFDLLAYYIYTKIIIVPIRGLNSLKHQNNAVVQPARYSLNKPLYYRDVSFSHFFLSNYKDMACLINKFL